MRADGSVIERPFELVEAELVIGLAREFGSLPVAGGILDQPASLLRMLRILRLAEGEADEERVIELADLQEVLGGE